MRFRLSILALILAATAAAQTIPQATFQELRWRMIGPFRGGRTRPAAGVPGPPMVLYIGQVNGGVWRSDDSGKTWRRSKGSFHVDNPMGERIIAQEPGVVQLKDDRLLMFLRTNGGVQWGAAADQSNVYVALSDLGRIDIPNSPATRPDPKVGGGLFALRLDTAHFRC